MVEGGVQCLGRSGERQDGTGAAGARLDGRVFGGTLRRHRRVRAVADPGDADVSALVLGLLLNLTVLQHPTEASAIVYDRFTAALRGGPFLHGIERC